MLSITVQKEFAEMSKKFVQVIFMKDRGIDVLDWSKEPSLCTSVRDETKLPKGTETQTSEAYDEGDDAVTEPAPGEGSESKREKEDNDNDTPGQPGEGALADSVPESKKKKLDELEIV